LTVSPFWARAKNTNAHSNLLLRARFSVLF
jgi:hypothetical protein